MVIDNDAGLAELDAQVDRLWRERLRPYEENLRHRRAAHSRRDLHIADYDPTWPVQAQRIIARIRHALGGDARTSATSGRRPCPGCRPRT